jgi:hypothetical protein
VPAAAARIIRFARKMGASRSSVSVQAMLRASSTGRLGSHQALEDHKEYDDQIVP